MAVTLAMHVLVWILSVLFAFAILYSSTDAWYALTRQRFLSAFLGLHLAMLPYYLLIAAVVFAWTVPLLRLWNLRRPSQRWSLRLVALVVWFWVSALSISMISHSAAWTAPFDFVRNVLGVELSPYAVARLFIPICLNAAAFLLATAAAVAFLLRAALKYVPRTHRRLAFALPVLGIFAFLPSSAQEQAPAARADRTLPNILLIGSDSLRADRLGCYGYLRDTSPAIDALAREGIVCERVYAASPSTLESLLSIFTGEPSRSFGVRTLFPGPPERQRARAAPTLASVLRAAGYRTVAVGDWSATNFDDLITGFDVVDVPQEYRFPDYLDAAVRRCHPLLLGFFATPATSWAAPELTSPLPTGRTRDQIAARIDGELRRAATTGQPLFLVSFESTTHLPYAVPDGEPVRFGDPAYSGPHRRQIGYSLQELLRRDLNDAPAADRQRIVDLYDSCVRAFDNRVAAITRALDAYGLSKDTLIVVFSDHGDDHWEPGTSLGRSVTAGDQSIRIPLVLRWPARLPPRRLPQLLRSTDLAPTIAELVNLGWPRPIFGRSFVPHLLGGEIPDDRFAYVEAGMCWNGPAVYPPEGDHLSYASFTDIVVPDLSDEARLVVPREALAAVMRAKDRALIRGPWKIVYRPLKSAPRVEMFDLRSDPHCLNPLPPSPELSRLLREQIMQDPPEFYLAWDRSVFDAAFFRD